MSRSLSALLPIAVVAALVPAVAHAAASTPTRVGLDEEKQVSFSMTGRDVTVTLRPIDDAVNPLAADLAATDVVLACRGTGPKSGKTTVADRPATWADGATSQTFRLSKDVSKKPKWCVLERPQGTDLAVTFKLRVVKSTT